MPGGITCSIKNCKNNSVKCKFSGITFHSFPRDPALRQKWINFCSHPQTWVPASYSKVCSDHFRKDDFVLNYREELLNVKTRRRLNENAVPTIALYSWVGADEENVHDSTNDLDPPNPFLESLEIKQQNVEVVDESLQENVEAEDRHNQVVVENEEIESLKKEMEMLRKKYIEQEKLINSLKLLSQKLAQDLSKERLNTKELENSLNETKQHVETSISIENLHDKIKELMSPTLMPNQVDIILKRKKQVKWTNTEIVRAFTLRFLSKQAYVYLRKECFPLPNIKTLQTYAKFINVRSGILKEVLYFMKILGENLPKKEKKVVLSYDEMKVCRLYEYDKRTDEIVGPYNYVQVVMARSLVGYWKTPVFVGFDIKMTKSLLLDIITELHNVSFDVVASVSGCDATSQAVLTDLGLTPEKFYFQHPNTMKKIYCFFDAAQLINLIRNWFISTGFQLQNGNELKRNLIEQLIARLVREKVSSAYKLSAEHINIDNTKEQDVTLACQLLSHLTATALKKYSNNKEVNDIVEFMHLINDWFDLMGSGSSMQKLYEADEEQIQTLNKMAAVFSTMLCIGKDELQFFQKSVIISVKSLQSLFTEMQSSFGINSLLTSKLSLDSLKNLFGQLRNWGNLMENPTPMNLTYRLKMVILGKTPENSNYLNYKDSEKYVTEKVYKTAELVPIISDENESEMDFLTTLPSSSGLETFKENALAYLSWWLTKKFDNIDPKSGGNTYTPHQEHNYNKPWGRADQFSYGRKKFFNSFEILDKHFTRLNRNQFAVKKQITKRLFLTLKKKVDLPEEITDAFIKQRLFLRIKNLNKKFVNNQVRNKGKTKFIRKLSK